MAFGFFGVYFEGSNGTEYRCKLVKDYKLESGNKINNFVI